jgi:hypothetical protein
VIEKNLGQLYIHIYNNIFKLYVGENRISLSGKDFRVMANFLNYIATQLPE